VGQGEHPCGAASAGDRQFTGTPPATGVPAATGEPAALGHAPGPPSSRAAAVTPGSPLALRYIPALDGLRGYMTLAVMAAHTRIDILSGASVYMDVFFAMSGFFITSILMGDYLKHGRINYLKFYYRRAARLYPALIAMLICFVPAAYLLLPDFSSRVVEAVVGATYTTNYYRILYGNVGATAHLWSLAIEEQYYLLWPVTFAALLRWGGISWKTVCAILGIVGAIAATRILLTYNGVGPGHLYTAFHTRADSLLIGCALAVALKLVSLNEFPRLSAALAFSVLPLFALSLVALFSMGHMTSSYFYFGSLLAAIGGACMVAATVQSRRTILHPFLENPLLVLCGRMSYGLYVWHWPIFAIVLHGELLFVRYEWPIPYALKAVISWVLAVSFASISYIFLERRVMREREAAAAVPQQPSQGRPATMALATT
jgi:peptidoglycan/LPS O-acetylase OafA/YrhL